MAEEEILTEQAPAPKKKPSGGFTVVHLILIAIVTAAVVAVGFFMISGSLNKATNALGDEIQKATANSYGRDVMADFTTLKECDDDGETIMPLSDKPLIVNMADGQHYLSIGISVCVSGGMTDDEFAKKKAVLLHVANEFLSQYSYSDIFPGVAEKEEAATPAASSVEMDISELGFEDNPDQSFALKKDQMRGGLLKAFAERNIRFVEEIYFTEFLVQ